MNLSCFVGFETTTIKKSHEGFLLSFSVFLINNYTVVILIYITCFMLGG